MKYIKLFESFEDFNKQSLVEGKAIEDASYDIAQYALHDYTKDNDLRKFRTFIEKTIKEYSDNLNESFDVGELNEAMKSALSKYESKLGSNFNSKGLGLIKLFLQYTMNTADSEAEQAKLADEIGKTIGALMKSTAGIK